MRIYKLGILPVAGLFVSFAASAATLMPLGDALGNVKLLDPAAALSGTNPLTVATGLTLAERHLPRALHSTTISGTTASNIKVSRLVFIRQPGSANPGLYKINLLGSASHTPVQFSSITDACDFETVLEDYHDVNDAWLMVLRAGADASCYTSDDVRTMVKLSATTSTPGISPAGLVAAQAVRMADGSIQGLMTWEIGATKTLLRHRDRTMANPVTVLQAVNSNIDVVDKLASKIFYRVMPVGQSVFQLFSYDQASNGTTISGPLYNFVGGIPNVGEFERGTVDANNLYFSDVNQIHRLPVGATTGGQTQLMTTLPASMVVTRMAAAPTSSRIVIAGVNFQNSSSGIYSVDRTASNVAPTALKTGSQGVLTNLVAVGGDLVYINVSSYLSNSISAFKVNADGTGGGTTASSEWIGGNLPTSFDFNQANGPEDSPQWVIKGTRSGGTETLRQFFATSANGGNTLGTISNVSQGANQSVYAFGFGRYIPILSLVDPGTHVPNADVGFVDLTTANSYKPVFTTSGDENVYVGH